MWKWGDFVAYFEGWEILWLVKLVIYLSVLFGESDIPTLCCVVGSLGPRNYGSTLW